MRRVALTAALLALAASPSAHAADTALAPATGSTAITAYAGQVVLSHLDPATGRWELVRWHAGVVDRLPVAERSVPFDADAGPDARGRPAVVYSRCTTEPPPAVNTVAPAVDWSKARGCSLHELSLDGGTPRSLGIAGTTPSIWRGAIAYADGTRIEYRSRGRTRRLSGGTIQLGGGSRGVEQLDLGPRGTAYVWQLSGGSTDGLGVGLELRAAGVDGGRSILLRAALTGAACGFLLPSAPSARRRPIAYLEASANCGIAQTRFAGADPATGRLMNTRPTAGVAADAAFDGSTTYWLRSAVALAQVGVPGQAACAEYDVACTLMASGAPEYMPSSDDAAGRSVAVADPVASGRGYQWTAVGHGLEVLRPTRPLPCAPSSESVPLSVGARGAGSGHDVEAYAARAGERPQRQFDATAAAPVVTELPVARCGARVRVTYVVGGRRRVTFETTRR